MREFVIPAAQLLFQPHDFFRRIDRLAELGLQKRAQLRFAQLRSERIAAAVTGDVPVIKPLLVADDRPSLQEAVHRHPSETGQAISQPDLPVPVQPVALIEKASRSVYDLLGRHAVVQLQLRPRRFGAHGFQHRAGVELTPVQDGLQRVPEDCLIDGGVPVFVQHGEELFQLFILIVPSGGTEDNVPVEIHAAAAVVGLEVRRKRVVLRAVPYDVVGAPLLKL